MWPSARTSSQYRFEGWRGLAFPRVREGVGERAVVSARNLSVPAKYQRRAGSVYNFFVIEFIPATSPYPGGQGG
jgi:hypothetical protein